MLRNIKGFLNLIANYVIKGGILVIINSFKISLNIVYFHFNNIFTIEVGNNEK